MSVWCCRMTARSILSGDGNAAVELVGDGAFGKAREREEGKAEAKQGVADGHGFSVGW